MIDLNLVANFVKKMLSLNAKENTKVLRERKGKDKGKQTRSLLRSIK